MIFGVILAGGVGTRMGRDIPKQYIVIEGKPVLVYTLERFQECSDIDRIVIVADEAWRDDINSWLKQYGITKFLCYADPGSTRQDSVFSGISACKPYASDERDIVVVHEAARALVSTSLICNIIHNLEGYDACIPVLPMKDSIIYSETGESVDNLLDRTTLFCGQAPESFYLLPYWTLHAKTDPALLSSFRADHELCYFHKWNIRCIPGEENNFKLTTPSDIDRMISLIRTGLLP